MEENWGSNRLIQVHLEKWPLKWSMQNRMYVRCSELDFSFSYNTVYVSEAVYQRSPCMPGSRPAVNQPDCAYVNDESGPSDLQGVPRSSVGKQRRRAVLPVDSWTLGLRSCLTGWLRHSLSAMYSTGNRISHTHTRQWSQIFQCFPTSFPGTKKCFRVFQNSNNIFSRVFFHVQYLHMQQFCNTASILNNISIDATKLTIPHKCAKTA